VGNISKTIRYLKRNGISDTYYAVLERLIYKDVSFSDEKESDFEGPLDESIKFSILVPVYETKEKHLREMIESCLDQGYPNFELLLADASKTDGPRTIIESYRDERVKYVKVLENKGISENTNVALDAATGNFCGLLDHDDLLTPDALYEMAMKISWAKLNGIKVNMVYSDEDKCDGEATKFFDRHAKQKLNLDLLLSNNYICHFSVIETSLIKELRFRGEYNGSQDYDLFLRVVGASEPENVLYINKVLYHWRCHEASTAFNPASKEYAYVAGRKAIEDFVKNKYGVSVPVSELSHKGFYKVEWGNDIFNIRKDVGAIGNRVAGKKKITSGIIYESGNERFVNMNVHFSGYMHRAHLQQDVYALDIRTVSVRPELKEFYDGLMVKFDDFVKTGKRSKDEIGNFAKVLGMELGDELKKRKLLFLYNSDITEI